MSLSFVLNEVIGAISLMYILISWKNYLLLEKIQRIVVGIILRLVLQEGVIRSSPIMKMVACSRA